MKLQGSSLILLITAVSLASAVYVMESQQRTNQAIKQQARKSLFVLQESEVQGLTLDTSNQSLVFQKTQAGDSAQWRMVAPQAGPAEAGTIAFLLNLMATGESQQTFKITQGRRAEFGFDRPLATIKVMLADQQAVILVVGKPTFDRGALYALVNPAEQPNQDLTVHLVSINFENAVTRPLTEWQKQDASPKKK